MMQLAHPKVAQVCLCWTMTRLPRMRDSPVNKPAGDKAISKSMQSALSPEQGKE